MDTMVTDEIRAEVRRHLAIARADPVREAEIVDNIAHWCMCAAIVVELARTGVSMPVELRFAVRAAAERIART